MRYAAHPIHLLTGALHAAKGIFHAAADGLKLFAGGDDLGEPLLYGIKAATHSCKPEHGCAHALYRLSNGRLLARHGIHLAPKLAHFLGISCSGAGKLLIGQIAIVFKLVIGGIKALQLVAGLPVHMQPKRHFCIGLAL